MSEYKTVIYRYRDKEIETYLIDGDIWLSQKNIAELLNITPSKISRALNTIDKNGHRIAKMKFVINKQTNNLFPSESVIWIGKIFGILCIDDFAYWVTKQTNYKEDGEYKIVRYNQGNISFDVRFEPVERTAWLNQEEIAIIFQTTVSNVSMHIKNIYNENELEEWATLKEFLKVQTENGRAVKRRITYYNLDMVLALGYRVKSENAITFRRWATSILKGFIFNTPNMYNAKEVTWEKFTNLTYDIRVLEKRVDNLEKKENRSFLFFNGQWFDAFDVLRQIINTALKEIIIIDCYVDSSILSLLSNKKNGVKTIIITSHNKSHVDAVSLDRFNKQYGEVKMCFTTKIHDRFIIIDNKSYYHIGPSINGVGDSLGAIVKTDDELLIDLLNKYVKNILSTN